MNQEHGKREVTVCDLDFASIMSRMKAAAGVETDAQVAALLGLSPSGYANRKRTGSLPFESLLPVASSLNVNLDWLLTGLGAQQRDEKAVFVGGVAFALDRALLMRAARALADALESAGLPPPHETGKFVRNVGLVGLLYNRAVSETLPAFRDAVMADTARTIAETISAAGSSSGAK